MHSIMRRHHRRFSHVLQHFRVRLSQDHPWLSAPPHILGRLGLSLPWLTHLNCAFDANLERPSKKTNPHSCSHWIISAAGMRFVPMSLQFCFPGILPTSISPDCTLDCTVGSGGNDDASNLITIALTTQHNALIVCIG